MSRTVEVRLNFTAETSSAEQALNRLQSSLRNISTQTNLDTGGLRFTSELNQASEAAIKLRQNLQNAINVNTNKLDLSKFQKEMDKSGMSLEKYRLALQQIGPSGQEAFTDLSKAILASQTPLTRSLGLFDKLWDTLKRTAGWQISSNIMHGFQSALSNAYQYAQDLNKSLNDIRIVTGYDAERMADFAKQANKAAKELSATTLDYTDASLIYYQQGLDDKAVKERTDTTIKMANVTGTTAQTVSQQMTAVWENFMKDGEHAAEYYADVMTALGAATASSTDEIADGLEKFAAVADTVGLSYEYATAALTTITAKTRQSADVVGTALKTLFARIEGLNLGETLDDGTTLNKYSSALEAVGVSIKDEAGQLKDMDEILDEIGSKWDTIGKDQQIALAQTVAGVRQYTQFVALMDNWDFMGENLATAYGAEGTLDEQQKIYEESWEAARNRLQASMETLYDDLLKDDFFIWLTDALSDVVGLIDKIVDSMGGLAGLLPGLVLLMNKLWGDKIINGISTVAYNVGGLIPSVNSKRQEADLALKDKTMAEWKIMQDEYQGNLNNSASKASYQAYSQISKIEETRLRLGKGITEQQTAILDTYREQLELLEKVAKTQGQQVDATRKERIEAESYISLLKAQSEESIRSNAKATWRSGAGSKWLNAVGANYKKGMDISSVALPQEDGAAAKGILKYLNEFTNRQIGWEDVQAYSSGNTANENYNAIASAIERLRDCSDKAEQSVARLNEILKFSPSSGENSGTLQRQAELVGTIEGIAPQLENIRTRMSNIGVGEESGENIAKLTSRFRELLETAGYGEQELTQFDDAIKDNETNVESLTATMDRFLTGSSDNLSITNRLTDEEEKLNQTLNELVTEYGIAPEAVARLRNALQNYSRTATNAEGVTEALKNAIKSTNTGLSQMGQTVDKIKQIQNITTIMTSLAMGVSTLKSAWETIQNPDISSWDKFVSILMSIGMAVGSFSSVFKTLYSTLNAYTTGMKAATGATIAQAAAESFKTECASKSFIVNNKKVIATIAEEAATENLSIAQIKQRLIEEGCKESGVALAVAKKLKKAATDAETGAIQKNTVQKLISWAVDKGILATSVIFVGVLLVISAIILGITALLNNANNNSLAGQVEGLKDATAEASEAAAAARQNYDDLKSTINDYEDAKDSINELTKGTREFEDAIDKANEKARALISDYGITDWTIDANGVIQIDEEALEAAQNKARQVAKDAEGVQSASSAALAGKQKEQSINDSDLRDVNYDVQGNLTNNTNAQTTSSYLASTDNMTKIVDAMNNFETDAIGFFEGGEEAFRLRVMDVLGWTEDGLTAGQDAWLKSLYQSQEALLELADSAAQADAKLQSERQLTAANKLANSTDSNTKNSKYKSQMANIIVQNEGKTKQLEQDAKANIDEMSTENKYKEYAKAKGYESWTIGTWADGLEEFYDADGEVHKVSDATIDNFLVEQEVQKKLGSPKENIVKNTVDYENSNNILDQALAAYAMSGKDISSLASQFSQETLQQLASLLNSNNANANQDYIDYIKSVKPDFTSDDAFNLQNYFADNGQYETDQKKALDSNATQLANSYGVTESYAQDQIETIMDLGGAYEDNVQKASEVVDSLLQTQEQLDTTAKSWKDNKDAIKNWASGVDNSLETQEKVKELQENLSKLFGGTKFNDKFIKDNLETIQAALEGDEEAYKRLQKLAAEEVIFNITGKTNFDELDPLWQDLYNKIENMPDLEIGASIDQAGLSDAFQALLDSGAITVAQMNSILSQIGFTPEVAYLELSPEAAQAYKGHTVTQYEVWNAEEEKFETKEATTDTSQGIATDQKIRIPIIGKEAMANAQAFVSNNSGAKITGNLSTYVGKGSTGNLPSSSSGGGGGGSKKDKKKASDEIERYHVVKQQLDRLSSEYDALSAAKDRAYGPDKLKAIDKEIAKLQEQEEAQKKYIDEINSYYEKDRAAIAAYGAVFDANGIITNYESLMQTQIDKFNASLTDEAEEAYNEFKEILDQYEETLALKLEEMNNLVEKQYEILSARLEQISYKVEFKVEINEAELNKLERKLSRLEDREIKGAQYFQVNYDKTIKYWQQYAYYQNGIFETEQLINDTKAKGLEVTEEMIQQLNEYKEKLDEIHDEIYEIQVDNLESILDNWDQQYEKLQDLNDEVETYRDMLESINDMRDISGMMDIDSKHSLDSSMIQSYQTSLKMAKGMNESLATQRAELVKAQEALLGGESTKGLAQSMKDLGVVSEDMDVAIMSAETLGNKIKDKIDEIDGEIRDNQSDYVSLAQEYLEYLKNAYVDNIELIGKKIKDELYDGIDWAVEKYSDLTDLSELYLSDTKKNYELNKLNRSIMQDINKLDSVAQKQKLRDLMEDINGYYADNVKMSEYELKNLQAQYELRLAEIALEEAQEAKSQVRLTRDNEGRWGYMYTANTEDLAQAEQEYEDKLYALQELQEDTLQEAGEKILELQQSYIDQVLEIQSSDQYTDEQKAARIESLTDIYQKQLDYYYDTYDKALAASGKSYEDTILSQASNTRSLQEVAEAFGQSTSTMMDQIEAETHTFQDAFVEMVNAITGKQVTSYEEAQIAWMTYLGEQQEAWSTATTEAATNFSAVMETFKEIAEEFRALIQDMLAQLALLSGEDMSVLIRQALAAGDYDMAVTYANARRAKIDANPGEYAQYDWTDERMEQEIAQYAKDDTMTDSQRAAMMSTTVSEAYDPTKDYGTEMQKALAAGDYDKAGLYAEYRKIKIMGNADYQNNTIAWDEDELRAKIEQYDTAHGISEEQKNRILATALSFDTGGYTGSWGSEGKLAILHEKELVLNADDTSKLLDAMKVVAQLDRMSAWAMLGNLQAISAAATQDVLEQNVHIDASFPNVVNHNEIEQAFENIVNLASQYANRK